MIGRYAHILVPLVVSVTAAITVGCTVPLLDPLEESLVFRPRAIDEYQLKLLAEAKTPIEEVQVRTKDGVLLHGWLKRPEHWRAGERHPLVIVFGGIRQEVSGFVNRAHNAGPWGWLVINYRGFGRSQGSPSERRVLDDARRIYDWAVARPDVDPANIVVLGRSLGSHVAVALAASRKVRAAILATPFDSVIALSEKYGVPLGWLLQDRYNPSLIAPSVSVPALFVLAENDDITPVKNGLALARLWGGTTKTVTLRGAGHTGLESREEFWRSVGDYLAALDSPQVLTEPPTSSAAAGSSTDR
jgi:pimeloyl-ACP methyl ester carboxylesterase